ncbi:Xaa-Pro aminopeptidase 2 [Homalodisca vitripennis]|nr:Xaa-Pro aminopeptidase 2 [Homalodisca vitripennis]
MEYLVVWIYPCFCRLSLWNFSAVVGLCLPAWAVNPLQGVESAEGSHRRLCPPMDNVPQPPERVNTTHLLQRLRAEMRRNNVVHGPPIDAYIVTTDDAHQWMISKRTVWRESNQQLIADDEMRRSCFFFVDGYFHLDLSDL